MEATVAMAWDCQIVLVDVPVLPAAPLQVRSLRLLHPPLFPLSRLP